MLRSSQIPPMLHRISGNGVFAAMVVTADGELLGTSYQNNSELNSNRSTLITDMISDYMRLGMDLYQRKLRYIEIEMSEGVIGVASAGPQCFVMALADKTTLSGLLKSRVLACASHVQDSLIPVMEAP
jgi:predicted regulator of Ras-like GTPase activity (Roadblock/LC7/MglB family)